MLNAALVKEADEKLALACVAVARLGEGATAEEKLAVNAIIYAVSEASRMLLELAGLQPPPKRPADGGMSGVEKPE